MHKQRSEDATGTGDGQSLDLALGPGDPVDEPAARSWQSS